MSRVFPDFLTAFEDYANDGFIPPQFATWVGVSIIAAALERKIWLPWGDNYSYFPNLYVMLVSLPGDGKSVALGRGTDLLEEANDKLNKPMNIISNQITESKFIEDMGKGKSFIERRDGKDIVHLQNAGFFYASEASNSLKDIFGGFIACLTDFYDCPKKWSRSTKKDDKTQLKNVCMNVLTASTFDYLGKLVNDENIMGGFASRLIYVKSKNKKVNGQLFPHEDQEIKAERFRYRKVLIDDLSMIMQMAGRMSADREFGEAWESWYMPYEQNRRSLDSEKVQSILARTNVNALKVSMVLAASEGVMCMGKRHWDKALSLVEPIQAEAPATFREARANSSTRTPTTLTNLLISIVVKKSVTTDMLKSGAIALGHNHLTVEKTVKALIDNGVLGLGDCIAGKGIEVRLLGNPDNYL